MIGNIFLLAISIGFIFFENKKSTVIQVGPINRRILHFSLGLAITFVLNAIVNLVFAQLADFSWKWNEDYTWSLFGQQAYYMINSVLYEEFIFRGILFFLVIKYAGEKKAILISSIAFGIYHWFSFGILGQVMPMIFVFIFTGLFGAMFAVSITRSGSFLYAVGLHLGWNFTSQYIFAQKEAGLFMPALSDSTEMLSQGLSFLLTTVSPGIVSIILIVYFLKFKSFKFEKLVKQRT